MRDRGANVRRQSRCKEAQKNRSEHMMDAKINFVEKLSNKLTDRGTLMRVGSLSVGDARNKNSC